MASVSSDSINFHTKYLCDTAEGSGKLIKALGCALDVANKSLKLAGKAVQVLGNLGQSFALAGGCEGLFGIFSPLQYFVVRGPNGKYQWQEDKVSRVAKIGKNAFTLLAKVSDLAKTLEAFELLDLGRISAKVTFQAAAAPAAQLVLAPLTIVKEVATMISCVCNAVYSGFEISKFKKETQSAIDKKDKWQVLVNDDTELFTHLFNKYTAKGYTNKKAKCGGDLLAKQKKHHVFTQIIALEDQRLHGDLEAGQAHEQAIASLTQKRDALVALSMFQKPSKDRDKTVRVFNHLIDKMREDENSTFTDVYRSYCEMKVARHQKNVEIRADRAKLTIWKNAFSIAYDVVKIIFSVISLTVGILALASVPWAAPLLLGIAVLGLGIAVFDIAKSMYANSLKRDLDKLPRYQILDNNVFA